uniref:Ycf54 n=1 Tax=Renouxia sp. TaxID=2485823 RepID=A0A3G3MHP9_9FLOR|nr:hypothetical protein [Renouxia sp.]
MTTYYFAVASQDFLLSEEPIEEILRERTNHYKSFNKRIDFWFVTDPLFLDASSMSQIRDQLLKPSAAVVSLNPKFIQWLKLRLVFVITGNFQAPSIEIPNPLGPSNNFNVP